MTASLTQRREQAAHALARAEAKAGLRSRDAMVVDITQAAGPRARAARRGTLTLVGPPARGQARSQVANVEELSALLPPLLPGQCVSITGSTSALLRVAAQAMGAGGHAALAALPDAGLLAAAQVGMDLTRTLVAPQLGSQPLRILAGLVDGLDVVVCGPVPLSVPDAGRLAARVRTRRAVLISASPWPGASWSVHVEQLGWQGMERGMGYARSGGMEVSHAHIRGAAAW